MPHNSRSVIGIAAAAALSAIVACATGTQERPAVAAPAPAPPFSVSGEVALHTLMSLGDAHLKKLADILTIVAASPAARDVVIVSAPPHGIACRASTARFMTTCSSCSGSMRTSAGPAARRVSSAASPPITSRSAGSRRETTAFRSSTRGSGTSLRPTASSSLVSAPASSLASRGAMFGGPTDEGQAYQTLFARMDRVFAAVPSAEHPGSTIHVYRVGPAR